MERRHFIKLAAGGLSALVVGSKLPWIFENEAYAAVQVHDLNFEISDAMKQMVTYNTVNNTAECYFWIFKEARYPAEVPGPNIFTTAGDTIRITLTNNLDEPHAFFIPGVFNTGPIPADKVPPYVHLHGTGPRHLPVLRQPERTGEPGNGVARSVHRHAGHPQGFQPASEQGHHSICQTHPRSAAAVQRPWQQRPFSRSALGARRPINGHSSFSSVRLAVAPGESQSL